MSNIFVFVPREKLDASANLKGFVDSCRDSLTVFGAELNFAENIWVITEWISLNGFGDKEHRLIFSTFASVNDISPKMMAEPYLSFAKAYVRYMQGLRPTKIIAFRMAALRALEAALAENGNAADPTNIGSAQLNRAADLIEEHYQPSSAYRIAGQLQLLAEFVRKNRLATVCVPWKHHLKRPGDTQRVGKEADEKRASKLPSEAALDALPRVFVIAKEPVDVAVSSIAAIKCCAPDRISEVLLLPKECEVREKREGKEDAYGLRWWPRKGAPPMVKWMVSVMAEVAREAVRKLTDLTQEARRIAKWYEESPDRLYLPTRLEHVRSMGLLSIEVLAEVTGTVDRVSANAWCKTNGVRTVKEGQRVMAHFRDVEKAILKMLPKGFPVLSKETGLKYSEALLVVRRHELNPQKRTCPCMIEAVTIQQVNTGLGSRGKHGFASIFSRLGFTLEDGSPIYLTTNRFRHYLNTIAQAGGMSQLDIAKWSGREDIRQNETYNHVSPTQMIQLARNALGDRTKMFGPLAELPKRMPISRDKFARLVFRTAHTTTNGFCFRDYTMSPCTLHGDCTHCGEHFYVKGDIEKTDNLRSELAENRLLMAKAKADAEDGYMGADRWYVHHKSTVERQEEVLAILDDPNVPNGTIIHLSSSSNSKGPSATKNDGKPFNIQVVRASPKLLEKRSRE